MNRIEYEHWLNEIKASNPKYRELFVDGKASPPIFFFGNPEGAVAATIGVNPSAQEFSDDRKWGSECGDLDRLLERCRTYFSNPKGVPPHPWFSVWEDFLAELGLSYCASPRAFHLDFSPRATRSVSSLQRTSKELTKLFVLLVENDSRYLLEQLRAFVSIRHLYMSGSVTKKYYFIEFLQEYQRKLGCRLMPVVPFKRGGRGQIGLYRIDVGDGITRRLFFCSTSPSARVRPHPLPQKACWLIDYHPDFVP